MKKIFILFSALLSLNTVFAANEKDKGHLKDTLYTELKTDIVILSSTKETNSLSRLPAAVSVFSPKNLEAMQISSFKDLSSVVPNYFVADYGSKMTAPIYIRGIGARSGFQTVSMYVDNIPYFNTTAFDTELFDIQRIEVLRGTQGTLYGRNAMGGIINVYTYSPLDHQGVSMKVGGGNYGQFSANASHYVKLSDKIGVSASLFYKRDDGYFKNDYDGSRIDNMENAGGRIKLVWNITDRLSGTYTGTFDWVDQGAFPYADINTGRINYNSEGYYKRNLITNGLALKYRGEGYEINSTTGYQYLNDEMNMDQDYTSRSVFQINQRQRQNSISQEITVKSNNTSWYQWSAGVYGFYDYLHTTPPVYMMRDGIQENMQVGIDRGLATAQGHIDANLPPQMQGMIRLPQITLTDEVIGLTGNYKRPTYGAAIFHQSTFNDVLTKGLSFTLGLRLDYEKTELKYDANAYANYESTNSRGITTSGLRADSTIMGRVSDNFLELLPKVIVKYEFEGTNSFVYASASKGYKAGGHNIQMFADLLQGALQGNMMYQVKNDFVGTIPSAILPMLPAEAKDMIEEMKKPVEQLDVAKSISYKPEYSWNYEVGGQMSLLDNALTANAALYYIDVQDVQLTQFVESGSGRLIVNGGKAVSKGFEVGLKSRLCSGFYLYANYGFADAKMKNYKTTARVGGQYQEVDYSNNYIPFAPRTTFSVGANVSYNLKNCPAIDRINFDTNFAGTGRIYWEESNAMSQGFYGTLNARVAFDKSNFTLEFWGKNVLDRDYYTFIFESLGNHFGQVGRPARWGASFRVRL